MQSNHLKYVSKRLFNGPLSAHGKLVNTVFIPGLKMGGFNYLLQAFNLPLTIFFLVPTEGALLLV